MNKYEAPEIIEVGYAEDVILGIKTLDQFDSPTQEYDRDPVLSDD
jgi:hypothetical protein